LANHNSKSSHGTSYYVCSKKRPAFPDDPACTNARHFRSDTLDCGVWDEFQRIVLSPAALLGRIRQKRQDQTDAAQKFKTEINDLQSRIVVFQEKRKKVVDAYTDGIISMGELRDRSRELDEQIKLIESQRTTLITQQGTLPEDLPEEEKLAVFAAQIREVLEIDDFGMKCRIVRHFVKKIVLSNDEATVRASLPRSLSCVLMSTASSDLGQESTGWSFQFAVAIPQPLRRKKHAEAELVAAD
jgi:hypothetical protein